MSASLAYLAFGDLDLNAIATSTGTGAGTGAILGPWGALIGGAIGAGTSIVEQATGEDIQRPAAGLEHPSGSQPVTLPPLTITAGQTPTTDPNAGVLPGVSNQTIVLGAAALVALILWRRRKG